MELKKAKAIAREIVGWLTPACERIVIAGSIRRRKPEVGDIELLCIPKFDGIVDLLDQKLKWLIGTRVLEYRPNKRGSIVYGPKNKLLRHVESGIGIDVFSTNEECWWVALVVRTGGEKTNKLIAMAAIRKGWHWHAYGSGFSTPNGELVCRSEKDVFEFVGLPYKEPRERE
jgi:DNA polymerase/3'-5' exonuclease PolX